MCARCPYCTNRNGKVHPLDSLGWLYPEVFVIWSKKNTKSPYEYSPHSTEKVWWECPDNKHNDYTRRIIDANKCEFRCPECGYSKGEAKISEYLMKNSFIKTDNAKQLINKNSKYYIPQKEFDGLVGLKGGNLSYDFYLPQYNLLVEYQGEFHDGGEREYTKLNLKTQLEHDKRKKEYAIKNKIKLLEIWYNCYDDIEFILDEVLEELNNDNNLLKSVSLNCL